METDDTPSPGYRAGWVRLFFGGMAMMVLPLMGIGRSASYIACTLYLVNALVMQVLIRRRIGESWRPLLGGLADIAMLTFLVHRVGSSSTALIALYIFIPVIYAMIGKPRVAYILGTTAGFAYAALMLAEWAGLIQYGPDEPAWVHDVDARPLSGVMTWVFIVTSIVFLSTIFVVRIARQLAAREQELLDANERLEEASQRDALTGLNNRRYLMRRLREELARVRRGSSLAVIMLDLDRFKPVNDDLGHLAGDELLRNIAVALRVATRENDVVGRYGGDEFLILLTEPEPSEIHGVADRIATAVRRGGRIQDHGVTASVGYALARADDTPEEVLRRADDNAYRAKQQGGDRAVGPPIPRVISGDVSA